MSNIYDLQKQEDELNSTYGHLLEDLQADIVCEDDYIILEFKQRNQRLYFPNRETLEKVLDLTRKTEMNMEDRIRELLEEFNDEVYNHDEMRQVERHDEGDGNHHYEFCCYKIYRDGNLSPIRYEFQDREYIYSDEDMIKRLETPFKS